MDGWVKQSTAITIRIGPFLDETDGKTPEESLTINQADIRLSKAGATFAQKNETTSCTHDENGYYSCPMNTVDTGTLGPLKIAVNKTGALPVWHTFMVISADTYDVFCGTETLSVDISSVNEITIDGSGTTSDPWGPA